jgi:hypothetical protein
MLPETNPGAMTYEAVQLRAPGRGDRAQGER